MRTIYHFLVTFLLVSTTQLFGQSVPSYVPTSGLVGWWGFNGNAQDGSGNGNHGTVYLASLTSDRYDSPNSAFLFDNGPDKITVPSNNSNQISSSFTISTWIKTMPASYGTGNEYHSIIQKWGNSGDASYMLGIHPNGKPFFYTHNSNSIGQYTSTGVHSDSILSLDSWHQLTFTYQSGIGKFYLNGVLNKVDSQMLSPMITSQSILFCSNESYIGYYPSALAFEGKLDDIGIWNRALTPQEITNLYNSQLPTQTSLCLPTITTTSPSSVGVDSAVIGGNITNDGGSSIVLRGVCYSTSPNPNMGNSRTEDGSGTGSFNTVLRGLNSSATYYARSYAKNSNGVVVYGNEVSFTTSSSLPGLRCPGTPSVTDIDGNIYNTVQIGNQCWTQSNLKVSKYRNGDSIHTGLSNSAWQNTTSGAYAIYNNDPVNDGLYGKLYNWYAVNDSRGLCPTGWHVPSDGEWTTLENQLGGRLSAGPSMMNSSTLPLINGWNMPPSASMNSSGFSGLPGGGRNSGGQYISLSNYSYWWSTTEDEPDQSWYRDLNTIYPGLNRYQTLHQFGFALRCLKNSLPQVNTNSVSNITSTTARVLGQMIFDGGDNNTIKGFCYDTIINPNLLDRVTINGNGLGAYWGTLQNLSPSTTFYVRAYATNSVGTSYGNELSFTTDSMSGFRCLGTPTVTDFDGNVYYTVQIGNQCWTQSNLKTSRYRNGDVISANFSMGSNWANTLSGAYGIYGNSQSNDLIFGKLYNHFAVLDPRGLCPTNWHVPTDGEWTTLVNNVGGNGGALKSTNLWNSPNSGANNSSGFTGLPGGFVPWDGGHAGLYEMAIWWSSTTYSSNRAWFRALMSYNNVVEHFENLRTQGCSVRCLKD